jgi:hypothetical protein
MSSNSKDYMQEIIKLSFINRALLRQMQINRQRINDLYNQLEMEEKQEIQERVNKLVK